MSVHRLTVCTENKQWLTHTHLLLFWRVAGLTGSECCLTADFSSGRVGQFKKRRKWCFFLLQPPFWDPVLCISPPTELVSLWKRHVLCDVFVYEKCFHFCSIEDQLSEAVWEYSHAYNSSSKPIVMKDETVSSWLWFKGQIVGLRIKLGLNLRMALWWWGWWSFMIISSVKLF